jgi:hypothetical protein
MKRRAVLLALLAILSTACLAVVGYHCIGLWQRRAGPPDRFGVTRPAAP